VADKNRPLPQQASLEKTTAERLAAIVEAAEQAATKVIDDAEAQGRRHLAEARAEAAEILARAQRLLDALSAAKERLATEIDLDEEAGADASDGLRPVPRTHLSAVAPLEAAEPEPPAPVERRGAGAGSPAGARLLATQMAVSGSSREEIAARLRNGFEVEDADAILDAILGPEEG
jgi:vacuolar-type H+-ATPase subunit H